MKQTYASLFQKSRRIGYLYRLFRIGTSLSCVWITSELFQYAVAAELSAVYSLFGILCVMLAVGSLGTYLLARLNEKLCTMEQQAFRSMLQQRVLDFTLNATSVGEMEVRFDEDGKTIAEYYQTILPNAVEGIATVAGSFIFICAINLPVAFILLLCSFLQMLPTVVYRKWAKQVYESIADNEEEEWDWLAQGVDGLRTLKLYQAKEWYVKRYQAISRKCVSAGGKAEFTGSIENIVFESIHTFLLYGTYILLGLFIFQGNLAPSQAPGIIVLSGYLFSAIESLFHLSIQSAVFRTAVEHLQPCLPPVSSRANHAVLEVEGVSKTFEDRTILSRLSFAVQPSEKVLLCGPNGSGKSTLLRMITGTLSPDSGEIRIPTEIAWSTQEDPDLIMTGKTLLHGLLATSCLDQQKVKQHFRNFHISEKLLAQPIRTWSMGERKKFFLSLALAKKAELLILDEPTNHIDVEARHYVKAQLEQYPHAMLISTHDPLLDLHWNSVLDLERRMPQ